MPLKLDRSNLSTGGASYTQAGVTLFTINVGGKVIFTPEDDFHGDSAFLTLYDNQFAVLGRCIRL
jgi:hypothetical protein